MGCASSTPADKQQGGDGLDIDIGTLERKKAATGAPGDAEPLHSQRVTSSGYMSDLQSDRPAFTHAFVQDHSGRNAQGELLEKYDTDGGSVLGRGACGSVVAVKHRTTKELYAMKVVAVDTVGGTLDELKREIEIQRSLDHPNICKIFESFEDNTSQEMYVIMEICTGGSLVSRMKTHRHGYGEKAAATLVEKMLSAIIYCHHHGVVHRDIKLDNFIYENEYARAARPPHAESGTRCAWPVRPAHPSRCPRAPHARRSEDSELKLIDFGFAAEIAPGKESMWDQLGTPSYMAPELWGSHEAEYDSSVDMWALGVVTYMLLSGKRPFHHQDKREKARMIRHDQLKFPSPEWDRVTQEAKDFCIALMQKKPRDRLAATNAKDHPWIKHASKLHSGMDAAHELARHNEIVESLESFCVADDLKKLALEVIAFSTPPAKLRELRDLFVKIDSDDSGTISLAEFKEAMSLHTEVSPEHVEQMFHDMDMDHSGEVDYSEFLSATLSAQKHSKESIMAAFNTLDSDKDGFITKSDLVTALDGQMTVESIEQMLQHADASGRVNFQTFKSVVLHGLKATTAQPNHVVSAVASKVASEPTSA